MGRVHGSIAQSASSAPARIGFHEASQVCRSVAVLADILSLDDYGKRPITDGRLRMTQCSWARAWSHALTGRVRCPTRFDDGVVVRADVAFACPKGG